MTGYEDILHLPYNGSKTHRMPSRDRAAQFSPFAALSGYEEEISEAGRQVEERIENGEWQTETLNRRLSYLASVQAKRPEADITYFVPDTAKPGGQYCTIHTRICRVLKEEGRIETEDHLKIAFSDVLELKIGCAPAKDVIE